MVILYGVSSRSAGFSCDHIGLDGSLRDGAPMEIKSVFAVEAVTQLERAVGFEFRNLASPCVASLSTKSFE